MKRILWGCVVLAVFSSTKSRAWRSLSPNGKVKLYIETNADGDLVYSVTSSDQIRLAPARAGILMDGGDLGAEVHIGDPARRSISETFAWRGNKTLATNRCEVAEIRMLPKTGPEWTLEVRAFDDGAAFRYRIPGVGTRQIAGESTAWHLPRNAQLWLQTDTGAYEGNYQSVRQIKYRWRSQLTIRCVPCSAARP